MLKGKAPIVIALVLGLLAALIAYKTMKRQEEKVKEGWNLVPVVVANRDIREGTVLEWDMVAQHEMPEQFVTPSVVDPKQFEKVVGQKLMVPLQRGDLILWSHFRSEGSFERLSSIVRKRGRAISLSISGAASVAGWVRPNDHVDILGTFPDNKGEGLVTVTLMQNIIVLATGSITGNTNMALVDDSKKNYSTITVLVLPEEAEILILAAKLGSLHLSLRNPEDIGEQEERGRATIETLLTGERVKALKKIRERTFQIIRLPTGGGGSLGR
ncbi:MAG: Flp pilus assembly protein CpaB [Deltaproteobacteria bacterium]|nr:MAG: Flp pilus assembly protein CpaB [Deltaproteobacteria bacterium]